MRGIFGGKAAGKTGLPRDSDDGVSDDGPVDRGAGNKTKTIKERDHQSQRVRLKLCQPLHEKEH